ncbi:FadR/GntR family transcriptional regulator [Rhodovibrionaceae bacterium A322]
MPIKTVEQKRLYQQVADQLSSLIRKGEFEPGKRLPAERELSKLLGVSRPTVREAMIALELYGLVEIRTGSGIFVVPELPGELQLANKLDSGPGPFEMLSARAVIEGEAAALAAPRITDEELDGIREALAAMEQRDAANLGMEEADRLFHVRIAEATHNSVLVSVIDELWSLRQAEPMWNKLQEHVDRVAIEQPSLSDHRLIIKALEQRDPRAARQAMHNHLERVKQDLLRLTTIDESA